ncbi:adipogenesis regulatory factor [Sceloporus undulatus]|uniref:adipogenesis regulatory factor n=1 Tax=Sceloporus undulatus TaxID=8520 RepID=UPI001C4B066D|nr:adipogenesis regulatory factor [Sceloporus undulatus]
MFKVDLAEQATKLAGNTVQDKVDSAGQGIQQVASQVTEAGQKVVDEVCRGAQDAGEKATQCVTNQINTFGKSFGQSEEKKNVPI